MVTEGVYTKTNQVENNERKGLRGKELLGYW